MHVQYSHFIPQHMETTHEALQEVGDMFLQESLESYENRRNKTKFCSYSY